MEVPKFTPLEELPPRIGKVGSLMNGTVSYRKRKKSAIEHSLSHYKLKTPENQLKSVTKTRSCQLCLQTGHHQYRCTGFKDKYGVFPLAKNDVNSRGMVGNSLRDVYGSTIFDRPVTDTRIVMSDFPTKSFAIVIHKRYRITNDSLLQIQPDNICIECTLIRVGCIEHELYIKKLWTPNSVTKYILKSKKNIVGSQLQMMMTTDM